MAEDKVIPLALDIEGLDTIKELKEAIRTATDEALKIKKGSDEWVKFTNIAAQARAKLADVQEGIQGLNPEKKIEAFTGLAQTVVGGFAAAQGAIGLFGASNDDLEKSILKVQSAVALLQGVQELATAGKKIDIVMTQLQTAAQSESVVVRWLAVAAQTALNAVMSANPIFIVIAAIGALVAIWAVFTGGSSQRIARILAEADAIETQRKGLEAYNEVLNKQSQLEMQLAQAQKQSVEDINKLRKQQLIDLNQQATDSYNSLLEQKKKVDAILNDPKASQEQKDNAIKESDRLNDEMIAKEHLLENYATQAKLITKQNENDIQAITDQATNLRLSTIKDGRSRELKIEQEALTEKLNDIKGEGAKEDELRTQLKAASSVKQRDINRKYDLEELQNRNKIAIQATREGSDDRLIAEQDAAKKERDFLLKDANLTPTAKLAIESDYEQKKNDLKEQGVQAEVKRVQDTNTVILSHLTEGTEAFIQADLIGAKRELDAQLESDKLKDSARAALQAQFDKKKREHEQQLVALKLANNKTDADAELLQLQTLQEKRDNVIQEAALRRLNANQQAILDAQMKAEDARYAAEKQAAIDQQQDLALIEATHVKNLQDINDTAGQKQINADKAISDAKISIAQNTTNVLGSFADLLSEGGKKQTAFQKGLAIAQIAIDTATAISAAIAASAKNPANGLTAGIAGAIQLTAELAAIAKGMAQAKQVLGASDAPASPNLTGLGGRLNTLGSAALINPPNLVNRNISYLNQGGDKNQPPKIKAYVVEYDISKTQKKINTITEIKNH